MPSTITQPFHCHIADGHGDPAMEGLRGQRPVTPRDYARLPELLNVPERVWLDKKEVLFEKSFGDERQIAVFEQLTKRRMLNLKSMRIYARRPRAQRP